jgi:hypothetical protein
MLLRVVMRAATLAAVFVLSAAAVSAEPPVIVGETKVKAGKLLRLSVELKPGESALWDAFPPDKIDVATWTRPAVKGADGKETKPATSVLHATGTGTVYVKVTVYRVTVASATDPAAIVTDASTVAVEFAGGQKVTPVPPGPAPGPSPKPGPTPPPAPTPENVSLFVAVVEDGPARTADAAKVMGDTLYWQSLKARGHRYAHYKTTSPEVAALGYLDEMKLAGVAPPAVLVMAPIAGTDTAAIRQCFALPKSSAEIDSALKKFSTK